MSAPAERHSQAPRWMARPQDRTSRRDSTARAGKGHAQVWHSSPVALKALHDEMNVRGPAVRVGSRGGCTEGKL